MKKKPHFYAHRVNTIEQLKNTPTKYGVEIDLRDWGDQIILEHDPFINGEDFKDWLKHYHHSGLILNIKSERIEYKILRMLEEANVSDFFFLDSSFPVIFALTSQNEKRIAVRFSEFECIETVLALKDKVDWVWVDCLNKFPLNREIYNQFRKSNFKLCLVSPDLLGRKEDIVSYEKIIDEYEISFDAICCKLENVEKWRESQLGK